MAENVGKIFTGIVVAGDDKSPDPQQQGRVKVLIPSLHSEGYKIEDLPWSFILKQASSGFNNSNRPPPVGTQVKARMLNNSGHFEVVNIIDAKKGAGGNWPASWANKAIAENWGDNHAGPPKNKDKTKQNETGKPGVTADNETSTTPGTVKEAYNPSPREIQKYKPIKKVSTAKNPDMESISNEMADALNNLSQFSLSDLFNILPQKLQNELKKNMPSDVYNTLQATIQMIGDDKPKSASNFSVEGTSYNPSTAPTNMYNALKDVKTLEDLDSALINISSNTSISDLSNIGNAFIVEANTGLANVIISILANGQIQLGDTNNYETQVLGTAAGVSNAETGDAVNFLQESSIATELIKRLPKEIQGALAGTLNEFATTLQKENKAAKNWTGS